MECTDRLPGVRKISVARGGTGCIPTTRTSLKSMQIRLVAGVQKKIFGPDESMAGNASETERPASERVRVFFTSSILMSRVLT